MDIENAQHIPEVIEKEKELIEKIRKLSANVRQQIFSEIMQADIADVDEK